MYVVLLYICTSIFVKEQSHLAVKSLEWNKTNTIFAFKLWWSRQWLGNAHREPVEYEFVCYIESNPNHFTVFFSSCCVSKKTIQGSLARPPWLSSRRWRKPRPTWTGWPTTRTWCLNGSPVKPHPQFSNPNTLSGPEHTLQIVWKKRFADYSW